MLVTTSWIKKNYNKFNKLYFNNSLPNIEFKISHSKHTWGFAAFKYDFKNNTIIPISITLSNYYDSPEDVKIQTLLHEMIHIKDYIENPTHYIINGKRVRANYYNAHGIWFVREAARITIESGYNIATHVTTPEIKRSNISTHSKALIDRKANIARMIVVCDGYTYWMFKTDTNKIENVKKLIKSQLPTFNRIVEYTFNNESLASRRSCNTKLSGWHMSKREMMNFAEKYKFTTIKSYHI